ncbi:MULTISPECIES: hypothetical protein [Methylomicrobium]|uniref:hypothetical protein n=1 Tax=Methylomicrobium TaxID=39773 RepID=UPI000A4DC71A|nr:MULTISPECIES: hypothetical protein [Methylomicrobium]
MNFHFFGKKISVAAKYHDKNALEIDCRPEGPPKRIIPGRLRQSGPQDEMN